MNIFSGVARVDDDDEYSVIQRAIRARLVRSKLFWNIVLGSAKCASKLGR